MKERDFDDGLLQRLSMLSRPAPDPARAEIVRLRLHQALARRRQAVNRRDSARRWLEPILVGGFSLIYFLAVVYDVLQWR